MLTRIIILLLTSHFILFAQNDSVKTGIIISEWLTAGPYKLKDPVAFSSSDFTYDLKSHLDYDKLDMFSIQPLAGKELSINDQNIKWTIQKSSSGEIVFDMNNNDKSVFYASVYVDAKRWIKGNLNIESCLLYKVFLNGSELTSNTSTPAKNCSDTINKKDIKFERGRHLLIIKAVVDTSQLTDFKLSAYFDINEPYVPEDINFSVNVPNYPSVEKLLEDTKINSAALSFDGKLAAVNLSRIIPGTDTKENWIEIYNTSDASLFRVLRGGTVPSQFKWSPVSNSFAYTNSSNQETTLWITELESGNTFPLIERIKNFSSYTWSPDGSFIIYSLTEKAPDNTTGIKFYDHINDRWPGFRNKTFLYKVKLSDGSTTRITAGDNSASLQSIIKDGSSILIAVHGYDMEKRPYYYADFYILDLNSFSSQDIAKIYSGGSALFSPDGKSILFLASPLAFDGAGVSVSHDRLPNDYDRQAYIFDISTKEAYCITKDFDPAISSAYWSSNGRKIFFHTTDKTFERVYEYDISKKEFSLLKLNGDVIGSIDFSANYQSVLYKGEGATVPGKVFFTDLSNGKTKLIFDPHDDKSKKLFTGETKQWHFTNERGDKIEGLIYFPTDFDSTRSYPCIVYFYGGTNPVEQSFEGRYPKNIWTANGYIVYVMQPSGAVGYGQDFSSLHVNDWGDITARDVISGTKLFLEAHPFVDKNRIGCIGASYGGFLTMNVLTKTDIFTTGVSHAGISSISSYWGEGFYGYMYNAVSAANSFPWNRKDIYVEQSPLYNADKITIPLLLLHGAADTNVPKGESWQMYTALKLLGKEVQYVEVADQDHHILDYKKRKQWTKTIIAWFDKYLKGQPEWWNDLYPEQ